MSSIPPSSYSPPPDPRQPHYGQPLGYSLSPGGPPASKALAGWALGLAIFPNCITWVLAIVFASIVMSRSKDGRDHGKRMAIAAFVIIGVWVVALIVVVAVLAATDADRDESGRVTDGGRASVLDLQVGDCLPDVGTGKQRTIELVPCTSPHHSEVYADFDLSGEFTTREEVTHLSEAGCFDRFEGYVGVKPRKSSLDVLYFFPPDEVTFSQDTGVTCILTSEGEVQTSLQGSER